MKNTDNVNILGVPISNVNYSEAIKFITDFLSNNQGFCKIYTPNVDFIMKAQKDINFMNVLNMVDLSVPDGKPLIWASRFLGYPLKEKISGSTLFFRICEIAEENHIKIFLLGGLPGAAEEASKRLQNKYGNIVSGYYCPDYGFEKCKDEIQNIINILKKSNSDLLVVGFGAPKQEFFIHQYKDLYRIPVSIALGGTIDFASGIRKMSPELLKDLGMGWLWRLIHEPKRLWRRYLIEDMKFFYFILRQRMSKDIFIV